MGRASFLVLTILTLFGLFVLAEQTFSQPYRECAGINQEAGDKTSPEENPRAIGIRVVQNMRCTSAFIEAHEPQITALGTLLIAAFTLTLWWSTRGLWEETKKAGDLANREFIATHRPLLKIRWARTAPGNTNTQVAFGVVNAGTSKAFVLSSSVNAQYWPSGSRLPDPHGEDGRYERNNVVNRDSFDIGATDRYSVPIHGEVGGQILFFGWIVYRDARRNPRTTYFAMFYNPGMRRFEPVGDPDYNAED